MLRAEIQRLTDLRVRDGAYLAEREKEVRESDEIIFGILANVSGGDWSKQSQRWREAAERWRDNWLAGKPKEKEPPRDPQREASEDMD